MTDQAAAATDRGVVDLSGAPAALDDATFDSLFPADGVSHVAPASQTQAQPGQTATQTQQTQQPAAQPQAQADDSFLKGDRSVYKTKDAALEGLNQKDALIEQLRQRYALTTGIDPITGQPVGQNNQPVQQDDYFQNPSKYLDDLYAAAKQGGPAAYRDVQAKFMLDTLKPLQPVLQQAARQQAVETASADVKDIGAFLNTPVYKRALEANGQLKDAIAVAESDFRFHSQLPGLYKTAYLVAQGMQLPEILRAQQPQIQTQTQTQARPTAQATTQSVQVSTVKPNLRTVDGIKAIIADAEARGVKLEF